MSARPRLRLLAADDDPVVRDAYRVFFAHHAVVELVAEARDGGEAIEAYGVHRPDVVLMDLQMPVTSGIDAIREITARWPDACLIAMTTFGTRDYVVAALRAGAAGYLLKGAPGEAVVAAIHQAIAGDMPLSSVVRRELVSSLVADDGPTEDPGLTPRETELLGWLAHGLTNLQIARRMSLSEGSVKQYVARASGKLGVVSRTQVLVRAIQLGLVDPKALPPIRG